MQPAFLFSNLNKKHKNLKNLFEMMKVSKSAD